MTKLILVNIAILLLCFLISGCTFYYGEEVYILGKYSIPPRHVYLNGYYAMYPAEFFIKVTGDKVYTVSEREYIQANIGDPYIPNKPGRLQWNHHIINNVELKR